MHKYESKLRQEQSERTKRAISQAVNTLAETKTLREMTIRELCQAAGVSVGAFYTHFKTREEAILYGYHDSDDLFSEMTFPPQAAPLQNLAEIMRRYLHMADLGKISAMRQRYIAHLDYSDPYFFSQERGLIRQLIRWAAAGQADGSIRDREPPEEIALDLLRFLRGLLYDLAIRTQYIDLSGWTAAACRKAEDYLTVFKTEDT